MILVLRAYLKTIFVILSEAKNLEEPNGKNG
jgi:hypothetical protein